jgi:hypothetical protein
VYWNSWGNNPVKKRKEENFMARNPKKRQKALQRKKARRKQKQRRGKQLFRSGTRASLRQAGNWPLHEVLLTEEWDEEGAIIQIMVARQSDIGQIAVGVFLVDLACLGVKNAYARLLESHREYQELREGMMSSQSLIPAELNLAAKIIKEGIIYARQFGFEPHRDYRQAKLILGDANPDACSVPIPLGGPEGKPLFIAGPYDKVDRIIAKLNKAVGPEGFHFMMPVGPDTEIFMDEDDEWEEV